MKYKFYIAWGFLLLLQIGISPMKSVAQELITRSVFEKQFEITVRLIVMLNVNYQGSTPELGAGFIFGHDNDHLFIATAYHVVHKGNLQPLSIEVRLKGVPGKSIKATLLKHAAESDLDLAVLSMGDLSNQGISVCAFPYDRLRMTDDLKRGDTVFPVGNPNGDSWAEPVEPDKVSQIKGKEIIFQSALISAGNSGGPLIDETANLVGMTTADEPPFGRAINIREILQRIKQWGYPISLKDFDISDLESPGPPQIHIDAMNNNIAALNNLLAKCNYPDETDMHYVTALQLAAYWGQLDVMKILLKAGADIEAQDAIGATPLQHAVDNFHNLAGVKFLIGAGAKINTADYQAQTALHKALTTDTINDETVLFLIHSGADVNLQDLEKNAALHYAISNQRIEIIKALLKAGANIEMQGKDKRTPLLLAIEKNQPEIIKLLILSGANVNNQHQENELDPLQMAAYNPDNIEIIKILLQAGAKVNTTDDNGNTPLQILVRSGVNYNAPTEANQLQAMTMLLKAGADVNIKNIHGNTALAAAKIIYTDPSYSNNEHKEENLKRYKAIEKLLTQYGAR